MPNLFSVTDPTGKRVICSKAQWGKHMLVTRPWMTGWEGRVRRAVKTPTYILRDASGPNRIVYYRREVKRLYLKVVVRFGKSGTGHVITAFPADSIKKGEELIWISESR